MTPLRRAAAITTTLAATTAGVVLCPLALAGLLLLALVALGAAMSGGDHD